MKLLYLLPGNVEKGLGFEEMERRRGVLQKYAAPDTEVCIDYIRSGPASIESEYEELIASVETVEKIIAAEKDGFDGVIIGCYGDPGLEGAREMVKIPVIGPGAASAYLAAMLCHRFSIVTITDSIVPALENLILKNGLDRKLASIRATNVSVLDINRDPDIARKRAMEEAVLARDNDGADCIVLGCMSLAFTEANFAMQDALKIPVVNPAVASLKMLETVVAAGLSHSKKAFQTPPKFVKSER